MALFHRVRIGAFGPARCGSRHFDAFLHRDVRCARRCQHAGAHHYQFFDQLVVWRAKPVRTPLR